MSDDANDEPMDVTRRTALLAAGSVAGGAALTRSLAPLADWVPTIDAETYFQAHYKELSRADMDRILAHLEDKTLEEYGTEVDISDPRPIPGVKFAYAVNLSRCNGNGKCVEACHQENNHDRASGNSYITLLRLDNGSFSLDLGETEYDGPLPEQGHFYLPVQCHQCDNPPCVSVCPVEATWKEEDGIVVIDYDWCIGCRYCEAACPYHARRFNWAKPEIPAEEINPHQGYLSNRIRPAGVVEKCTFCLHRTRVGLQPACLEACPTGARVFGDLADPNSDIRWIFDNKRVFILKEELGTLPRFFYFFDT